MQKMKNGKKVLSVCLSLAMAAGMLSTSAFASWNVYGGSNNHNAVVTEAPTTPDKSGLDSYIQLHCTGSGWDGVDNVPVMQTVNGTIQRDLERCGAGYRRIYVPHRTGSAGRVYRR